MSEQQSLASSVVTSVPAPGETGAITINYQVLDDGNPVQTNVSILQVSVFFDSTQVALSGLLTDTLDGAGSFVVNPLLVDAGFTDISENADGQPIAEVSPDDADLDGDAATDSQVVFNFFDFGEDLPFGADGLEDATTVELLELSLPTTDTFGGDAGDEASPINVLITDGTPADFDEAGSVPFNGALGILVENVAPFFVGAPFTFAIDENTADGTVVGTVAFDDPNPEDVAGLTLEIEGLPTDDDDEPAFAIDADGNITVSDSDDLDFEVTPTFNFNVTVTDDEGLSGTAGVTVNLNDLDDNAAPELDEDAFEFGVTEVNPGATPSDSDTFITLGGATSVLLDPEALALAGLTISSADGTAESAIDGGVAFAVDSDEGFFTFTPANGITPVSGTIEHSGSVSFNDDSITVGDFTIGFDGDRVSETASGFFVQDNISFPGTVLFDIAASESLAPGVSDFDDFQIAGADLLVSPEFAQTLLDAGLTADDLTGADAGDAEVDGESGLFVGNVGASDPDGDDLTFSLAGDTIPPGFGITPAGDLFTTVVEGFDFETAEEDFGFDVEVSDGQLTDVASVAVGIDDRPELLGFNIAIEDTFITPLDLGGGAAGDILSVTLDSQSAEVPLELGVILFDPDGNVLGVSEGEDGELVSEVVISIDELTELDEGEQQTLLDNSATLLSTLASEGTQEDVPFDLGVESVTRTIDLSAILGPDELGDLSAGFFFVSDSSIANFPALDVDDDDDDDDDDDAPEFDDNVFFGDDEVVVTQLEGTEQFQIEFEEDDFEVSLTASFESGAAPVGAGGLQGIDGDELLDFTDAASADPDGDGFVIGNLSVNQSFASFDNLIAFVEVDDESGSIDGIDADFSSDAYLAAALANLAGVDGSDEGIIADDGVAGITADDAVGETNFIFEAGELYLPVIVANGGGLDITGLQAEVGVGEDGDVIAFSGLGSANSLDNADHVRLLGDNLFGFEDLLNTGDADFNDNIVGLTFA